MRRFICFFLIVFFVAGPVMAAVPTTLELRYGAYSGGFKALDIRILFRLSDTHYTAQMIASPSGTLGKLLPWAGTYATEGLIKNGRLQPMWHDKHSAWRDDTDQMKLTYNAKGVLITQQETSIDNGKTNSYPVKPDKLLHEDTVDIMTAILQMLYQDSAGKGCDISVPTFDGKRRFDATFRDKGIDTLVSSKLNMASGTAEKCEFELIPRAGFTGKPRGFYRIQEEARAQGTLPFIHVGKMNHSRYAMPLKITIKSGYGTVFIHLQEMKQTP